MIVTFLPLYKNPGWRQVGESWWCSSEWLWTPAARRKGQHCEHSTELPRVTHEFLKQFLLLALCCKGFWQTSRSRKKSLSKAYVISYLCLFVCNKIKIEWVVLTEHHRNSSWLEMESARVENPHLLIHWQLPRKSVIKFICINSCLSSSVQRNTISSRGWLWSQLSSLSDLRLLT